MGDEDRIWFEQWKAEFSNALAGSASTAGTAESMVDQADRIAIRAVKRIRERAAEADAKP